MGLAVSHSFPAPEDSSIDEIEVFTLVRSNISSVCFVTFSWGASNILHAIYLYILGLPRYNFSRGGFWISRITNIYDQELRLVMLA